jgi:hypothetical protein
MACTQYSDMAVLILRVSLDYFLSKIFLTLCSGISFRIGSDTAESKPVPWILNSPRPFPGSVLA